MTEFLNETRVLKEVSSTAASGLVANCFIAALWTSGLEKHALLPGQIEIRRFSLRSRKLGKHLSVQLFKYFEFCTKIALHYRNKNVKFVNIHNLALLPLGVLLKHFYGAKLVYDTHELETEAEGLVGLRKSLAKSLEKKLIKYCDRVFVVSENIADWYSNEYKISRPDVILNAPRRYELEHNDVFRRKFPIKDDAVIVLYQGLLAEGRGIHLLLKAFEERIDKQDVVLVLMGYGPLEKAVTSSATQSSNIFFHPAVSPEKVLIHTISADVGISYIENTCLSYYYCLPNKLFEYAMCGLPVLVSNMKEMSKIVQHHKMGYVVSEATPQALNRAIDDLMRSDLNEYGRNARKYALDNAWEEQEKKMIISLKRLVDVIN